MMDDDNRFNLGKFKICVLKMEDFRYDTDLILLPEINSCLYFKIFDGQNAICGHFSKLQMDQH